MRYTNHWWRSSRVLRCNLGEKGQPPARRSDHGEGLYAAGGVAANPFGFLASALVFGTVTARNAAEAVENTPEPEINAEQLAEEKARIESLLTHKDSIEPHQLEYKTRRIVNDYVQPPKSERRLKMALERIKTLREEASQLQAKAPHTVMEHAYIFKHVGLSEVEEEG